MKSPRFAWKTSGWSRPAATALASLVLLAGPAFAAPLDGQVLGAGAPIANSTVTLWQAGSGAPRQLAQARSGADGRFTLDAPDAPLSEALAVPGGPRRHARGRQGRRRQPGHRAADACWAAKAPAKVTINEMTTVASVWTHNQFIDGDAIKGQPLQLKIAAGNVPSFVDLADRRLGRHDPGPAEQRPDADDGELRHAGQRAGRLRHARAARGLRDASSWRPRGRRAPRRPTR